METTDPFVEDVIERLAGKATRNDGQGWRMVEVVIRDRKDVAEVITAEEDMKINDD